MTRALALIFFLALMPAWLRATVFLPASFKEQVQEASLAVEAKLVSIRSYRTHTGAIASSYRFKVLEKFNMTTFELEDEHLEFTLPIGSLDGETVSIDGAPEFKKDQRIFLLLKRHGARFILSNFTMGVYNIEHYGAKVFYVSSIFPNHKEWGKIEKEQMIKLMSSEWGLGETQKPGPNSTVWHSRKSYPRVIEESFSPPERAPAQSYGARDGSGWWYGIVGVLFTVAVIALGINRKKNREQEK